MVNNIEYSSYYLCKSFHRNYLFNYRTKQFYANSLSTQTNELFSFDSDIKDTIVSSIINRINSNQASITNDCTIYSTLIFYLNSIIDEPISDSHQIDNTIQIIYQIIINLCRIKFRIGSHMIYLHCFIS